MDGDGYHFRLADYLVFVVTLAISVGIGVYYAVSGGKQRTTSEFLLGSRQMSFVPVGISLFVSFESSIMMLGMPAEGYMYGLQMCIGFLPYFLTNLLCAWITVPLLHPLKITSGFEYLELRYNSKTVRMLGSAIGVIYDLGYMGIVLFGPAVALEAVTDFPLWISIFGLALMAVIYTSIGGLKAVIWADVFQTVVMLAGMMAVLIKGTVLVGGPKEVWDTAASGGRMNFWNFDLDPRTRHAFVSLIFSHALRGFTLAFKQSTVQRISSTKNITDGKKVMFFVAPCALLSSCLSIYQGVVAYAYYDTKQCDPFKSGRLSNINQIIPYIVLEIFDSLPGMSGLFTASLFSASLSTLSSNLSSLSALLWVDFIHPIVGDIAEWKATLIAKILVVVCGALACLLAWLISFIGGTLQQIAVQLLSAITGPLLGLFFLGCFCPRSQAKGVVIGGALAFAITFWIANGMSFTSHLNKQPFLPAASTAKCSQQDNVTLLINGTYPEDETMTPFDLAKVTTFAPDVTTQLRSPEGIEHLYSMSYLLIGPVGIVLTITLGYLLSIFTGANRPGDVDPRYLLPVSDSLLVWLPKPVRRYISSLGTQFINIRTKDPVKSPELPGNGVEVKHLIGMQDNRHDKHTHGDWVTEEVTKV